MSDHHVAERFMQAARVMALAAELNCKVAGMDAENKHRVSIGESIMYGEDAFEAVIVETGCHHNNICMIMQGEA